MVVAYGSLSGVQCTCVKSSPIVNLQDFVLRIIDKPTAVMSETAVRT